MPKKREYKKKQEEKTEVRDPKQKDDFERIGKWKSTKGPDFTDDIFEAAKDGKLSSVVYLLANGTNVNSKNSFISFI